MNYALHQGDCLEVMRGMADCSVDAVVTDPPAGISFMGKEWDSDKGGRDAWIAWLTEVMRECWRVLKPGGHAVVWALPHTSHWTGMALENAGFEVRDCIVHHHGSGFPKSHDVSKAIDKAGGIPTSEQSALLRRKREAAGLSREDVALQVGCTPSSIKDWEEGRARTRGGPIEFIVPSEEYRTKLADLLGYTADERVIVGVGNGPRSLYQTGHRGIAYGTATTPEAAQWEGWGTALKPASEFWWLVRKPLVGAVAQNVLEWGTGALNVDGCRVEGMPRNPGFVAPARSNRPMMATSNERFVGYQSPEGRWPANLLLTHSAACGRIGERRVKANNQARNNGSQRGQEGFRYSNGPNPCNFGDEDGLETVEAWECADDCPVKALDEQSGTLKSGKPSGARNAKGSFQNSGPGYPLNGYGDIGTASRFFTTFEPEYDAPFLYCPKPSKRERNAGLDGIIHNTPDAHNLSSNACGRCGLRVKANGSGNKCECGPLRETIKLAPNANHHPTVKATRLMAWLIKLVTPPGGIVLDPFMGSGSTGRAAMKEGFQFVGVERDPEYFKIAQQRIADAYNAARQLEMEITA